MQIGLRFEIPNKKYPKNSDDINQRLVHLSNKSSQVVSASSFQRHGPLLSKKFRIILTFCQKILFVGLANFLLALPTWRHYTLTPSFSNFFFSSSLHRCTPNDIINPHIIRSKTNYYDVSSFPQKLVFVCLDPLKQISLT